MCKYQLRRRMKKNDQVCTVLAVETSFPEPIPPPDDLSGRAGTALAKKQPSWDIIYAKRGGGVHVKMAQMSHEP